MRFVIVATGEGALARVIESEQFLKPAIHDFMCACGTSWDKCCHVDIAESYRMIDDLREWTNDEGGDPFSVGWEGETGRITIYRLTE